MAGPTPNAALTNFAVTYTPPFGYVAEEACPVIAVPRSVFEYYQAKLGVAKLDVDTVVSPTGAANEVEDPGAWVPGKVINEALKIAVPQQRIDDYAGLGYDPREGGIRRVKEYMELRREVRTAALMFAAATYGTNHADAGTAWDQDAANPIDDILAAQAACLLPANTALFGLDAWAAFRANVKVIAAINPVGGNQPTMEAVRGFLASYGIDEVIIARGKKTATKKGKTATYEAIWGDSVAVYFKNPERVPDGTTFVASFAVELGGAGVPYRVDTWSDKDIGTRGGEWVKTSREIVEAAVEALCGYLITDVKT